jgi:hypothetical protein
MSRGLGKVQRALLAILADFERKAGPRELEIGLDTITLAHRVYGRPMPMWFKLITTAQEITTRRALAGLARDGMVRVSERLTSAAASGGGGDLAPPIAARPVVWRRQRMADHSPHRRKPHHWPRLGGAGADLAAGDDLLRLGGAGLPRLPVMGRQNSSAGFPSGGFPVRRTGYAALASGGVGIWLLG